MILVEKVYISKSRYFEEMNTKRISKNTEK